MSSINLVMLMFLSSMYLLYKAEKVKRDYKILFGNVGVWVLSSFGIIVCVGVVFLGFIPPSQIDVGSTFRYELILIIGILVLCLPPIVIYKFSRGHLFQHS